LVDSFSISFRKWNIKKS